MIPYHNDNSSNNNSGQNKRVIRYHHCDRKRGEQAPRLTFLHPPHHWQTSDRLAIMWQWPVWTELFYHCPLWLCAQTLLATGQRNRKHLPVNISTIKATGITSTDTVFSVLLRTLLTSHLLYSLKTNLVFLPPFPKLPFCMLMFLHSWIFLTESLGAACRCSSEGRRWPSRKAWSPGFDLQITLSRCRATNLNANIWEPGGSVILHYNREFKASLGYTKHKIILF